MEDKLILEQSNFLPIDLCEKIIDIFENTDSVYVEGDEGWGVNRLGVQRNKEDFKEVEDTVMSFVKKAIEAYDFHLFKMFNEPKQKHHMMHRVLKRETDTNYGVIIHKLRSGNTKMPFRHWHTDSPDFNQLIGGDFIQMVFYLNDIEEGKGGCTEFINPPRIVKPETGKLLAFPCSWTHPHRGQELSDGVKYIMTVTVTMK